MAYADDVLALSPLLYYILDQTGTDNPVESVSNISTSLTAPYTWGVTGPVSGYTALDLSGGYAGLSRQGMTGNITRAGWVKTTSTDSTTAYDGDTAQPVLGDASGSVWDCFGLTGGKVEYRRFNNSTWDIVTGATSVNDGNWHHVAVTYNSSTRGVVLFVDGVSDGTGTIAAHQTQGGIGNIGRGYDSADVFSGSLAHLCAWNSILTNSDIELLAGVSGGSDITATLSGTGAATGTITGAVDRTASLSGTGSVTADLGAAGSEMVAGLSGSGALSATWSAGAFVQAALTGTGSVSGEFLVQQLGDLISWGQVSTGWARQRSQIGTTISITNADPRWAAEPAEAASR